MATTLFRIFQEGLTNVARHAGATQVEAALTVEGGWVTERVQDNGRGMTDAEMRFARGAEHGALITTRLPQYGRPESM